MNFDRETLRNFQFFKGNSINVSCSTCHRGLLVPVRDKFIKEKTAYVKRSEKEDYYNGYDYEARVCYLLVCNNNKCEEPYLMSGIEYEDFDYEYDHHSGQENRIDIIKFKPLFFTPTIHLFKIHTLTPKPIADEIIKSFNLFFNDLSSAANKIRISVELLLNHFNIKPSIYMDNRIKEFNKTHGDISEKLSATKIIGNSGSHVSELSRDNGVYY